MTALANLAKYQGRYDQWQQLRQRYNLKWSKGDSIQYFERFFSQELTLGVMMQRIRQMMAKLPLSMQQIIKFAVLTGLRASEVCESVRLLNIVGDTQRCYYNPERGALEHFRFPQFLRTTKKAYISFITREQLSEIGILDCKTPIPTYETIRYNCWKAGIKCDLRFCRKIFASHLRSEGIQPEIIDLLQGRCPQSVLTQHYLVASGNLRETVLQALEKLQQQLD